MASQARSSPQKPDPGGNYDARRAPTGSKSTSRSPWGCRPTASGGLATNRVVVEKNGLAVGSRLGGPLPGRPPLFESVVARHAFFGRKILERSEERRVGQECRSRWS